MGDSHYVSPGDPDAYDDGPELTRQVVMDYALAQCDGGAFFTRVACVVTGDRPDMIDRRVAWGSFAFSNFVQSPVVGPRIAPTAEQFADARARFFGQLAITRPEVLIVLGARAWNELPDDVGAKAPAFAYSVFPDWSSVDDAWLYPHWVGDELICTLAVKIVHPSAGFGRWNLETATQRAQSARHCHSNVLEYFYDNYVGVSDRPFWL